ncbi:hypothetical protein BH11PLA2_BH11PLA2_09160 [soil metagenome]
MTTEPFLKPRLTGARFEDGAIPLEVLADFAVLSEMIVEVAKWKYREDNRKRVPRGFADGISLKLTGIESGSAIPVISLVVASTVGSLLPSPTQTYFEEARQAIVEAVGAAEQNKKITTFLPQKLLGYFDRFGRNLAEGEAIELQDTPSRAPVRLTKDTRRKLILASSAEEFTEETDVHGLVHEFDQKARTFQLTLANGATLYKIPVQSQHYDTVLEASNGFRDKLRARVYGVGRFDRNNRLQAFEEVEHVTILDPLDIRVRLDELKSLRDGWMDGKGNPLNHDGLEWLADAFDLYFPDDVPLPYLFPTPKGNVLAEWSLKPWSPSLEINLALKQAEWHSLNLDTDEEVEKKIDLTNANDWKWLGEEVRTLSGEV